MSADAWVAVILAAVGLLAVYCLPRAHRPIKMTMPRRTVLQDKRKHWR